MDESYAVADAELLEEVYSSSRGQGYTGYTPAGGGSSAPESEPAASETSRRDADRPELLRQARRAAGGGRGLRAAQLAHLRGALRRAHQLRRGGAPALPVRPGRGLRLPAVSGGGGGRVTAATK